MTVSDAGLSGLVLQLNFRHLTETVFIGCRRKDVQQVRVNKDSDRNVATSEESVLRRWNCDL